MSKPTILTVDDDAQVSAAIARDLSSRYASEYRVVRTTSGAQALSVLARLALRDQPVALIAADQRMPSMTGIELMEQSRTHAPGAKLLLLTAYADTDVAITAINEIGLDYYLLKPWDPPEDRLYPIVDDLLGDWRRANPVRTSEVRIVGHRWSERSHDLKTFLARNHVPYAWYDVERDDEGRRLRDLAVAEPDELPLVLVPDGETLRAPSAFDVAGALGLHVRAEQPLYDVCIVGAGPAGLAAAVYAASEGLRTVVVEREAPGGQAGQSASIENYLGFPRGLSGADLAHRALAQVSRFGAEMVVAREVVGFETRGPVRAVLLDGSGAIEARGLILATGVSYRRLPAEGLDRLVGRGVYYGADAAEASQCAGDDVYHRRRGQLRRPGGAEHRPLRPAGRPGRPPSLAHRDHVAVPAGPDQRHGQHRRAVPERGRGRPRRGASGGGDHRRPRARGQRGAAGHLAVRVHRRLAADGVARRAGGP